MSHIRLGYVILYVSDVKQSLAFHEQAFGLKARFLHESGSYAELLTGETTLAFCDEKEAPVGEVFVPNRPSQKAAGAELAFVVDDVQQAFDRAVAAGAQAVLAPTQKPWGQTVAYVRDNSGFLVELCTSISD